MKPYPEYKDSGVEWIGEIPSHWVICPLKYHTRHNINLLPEDTHSSYKLQYIEISDVNSNGDILGKTEYKFEDAPSRCRRVLYKGDVLISTVRTYLKSISFIEEDVNDWVCSTGFCVLSSNPSLVSKFLFYMVRTEWFVSQVISNSVGVSYPAITPTDLVDLDILFSPLPEQQQIVSYLDEKTQQIDQLIQNKEQKIKLLQEKRTAVINHAVSKGLNPDVEMKNSGVEWIGEIPKGWTWVKLKFISNQVVDGTHNTPEYVENGIPFLRVTDIHEETVDLTKVKFISTKEHEELSKRCKPEKGDLLLSKNGTIGITKVVDWDFEFSVFVSLCLIKFKKDLYSPYFFSYLFQSTVIDEQIRKSSKTSTVTNLHLDQIREFSLIEPTLFEQTQIVSYLDEKNKQIDQLISQEQRKIELLKEYRQSLISDAVTGKIDVREAV